MTKAEHEQLRARAAVRIHSTRENLWLLEQLLANAESIGNRHWFDKLDSAEQRAGEAFRFAAQGAVPRERKI
jgi:hypothetical protein